MWFQPRSRKQNAQSDWIILFWCYKEPQLCLEKVTFLGQLNPGIPIYVLYGGPLGDADNFEHILAPVASHFYRFEQQRDPQWKWQHGEELLLDWYRHVGRKIPWRHLFIHQWDMLVCEPI